MNGGLAHGLATTLGRRHHQRTGRAGAYLLLLSAHPFLQSERTCQWLADALEHSRQQLEFSLWAYVFMPEHVHLIVFPQ